MIYHYWHAELSTVASNPSSFMLSLSLSLYFSVYFSLQCERKINESVQQEIPGLHVHMASSNPGLVHLPLRGCQTHLNEKFTTKYTKRDRHRKIKLKQRLYVQMCCCLCDYYAEMILMNNEKSTKNG